MHAARALPFLAIRDHLLADRSRQESALEQFLSAFEENGREDVARSWTEVASVVLAQLEGEETNVLPALLSVSQRDARVMMGEHNHLRARMAELGTAIDLRAVRLESARDFVEELRAHGRSENRLLLRWAEEHLDEEQWASLFETLGPAGQR